MKKKKKKKLIIKRKKNDIRFLRLCPKPIMNQLFLTGKVKRYIMVYMDPYFIGQPDHLAPYEEIPKMYKDGIAAEAKASEIFQNTIEELKAHNWKFSINIKLGKKVYVDIMEKHSKTKVKEINLRLNDNPRSLIVFTHSRKGPDDLASSMIERFLRIGKPVCIVDQLGIKRYPRYKKRKTNRQ